MMGAIAPGLSIELIISFESSKPDEFRDSVTIISEDDVKIEIPIYAYSPTAKIIFEPFINMGFVQVGKEKRETVKFRNEGSIDKRVDLKINEIVDLKIYPSSSFIIKASEEVEIELSYTPVEAGIFRGLIEVITEGQCFLRQIDVNATCVEFLKFIINDKGEELNKLDFGTVLFGQRKKILGYLVNNSPENFFYKITYIQGLLEAYQEEQNL